MTERDRPTELRLTELGLPPEIRACLFDLDGVLTSTADVHAAAWKEMFDELLRTRAEQRGEPFTPFDLATDYGRYVDGRPRAEGTRSFLHSRGIDLPEGGPDDPPDEATVYRLSARKNDLVNERIARDGVAPFPDSRAYVERVLEQGLGTAVVSSSANCRTVLAAAGIEHLFTVVVDGVVAVADGLAGKPAPDTFLAAARALNVSPPEAAVFEDALAGVAAGRAGDFGYVVGVDRLDQADALAEHGADVVVAGLGELPHPR